MDSLKDFLSYVFFEYKDFKLSMMSLLSILLLYLLTRLILWGIAKVLDKGLTKKSAADPGRKLAILQIAKYFLYTIALVFALQSLGINITILVTGSAALLVGVGFGLQHTFNDFFSGLILLFDRSIEVNDIIQVGDLIGRVMHIGLRATTINTRDAISVIVPNSKFTQENIINWNHDNELIRFGINIGVAYGSNVELVMQTMNEATASHPQVSSKIPVCTRFVDFADSALLFEVLFWTNDTFGVEYIKSDIRVKLDAAFREADIKIPFPQRDLHLISDNRSINKIN